ncbi:hypothetical protein DSCOOX_51480 [Desulfosarcina ovata subsp. ovata]|uniref:Uncharacterized protein n=2 Tax=Desulfosarcina ovata TaxID=83564 RepID=A0A5K8AHD8_9BACT|nr:hypothetical protein DSCOOX_51480 [Desulfosarcina ovata subsp. ovata]
MLGQWILYQYLQKGDYLFDYGIFGLILLFMATYQIPNMLLKFNHHGKILYSKLKNKHIISSNKELSIINPNPDYSTLNLDEIVINLVDSRFREDAIRILDSCKTRKDYIKAIVILTKYITKEKELSLAQIVLSMIQIFGSVFIFSVLVFGATGIALKLFNLNIALSNKDYYFVMLTFISFWIALSVSIFAWCHPELLKQIKRNLRKINF